jgi:hypothetical protein
MEQADHAFVRAHGQGETQSLLTALPALPHPITIAPSSATGGHAGQLRLLQRFLSPATTFLELCGDNYSLALAIAEHVKRTYAAVDPLAIAATGQRLPTNFHLVLTAHTSVPVPCSSIDVAYARDRLEVLQPAQVRELFAEVHRALAPHGTFVCVAMRTCTIARLPALLRQVGFRRVTQYVRWRDRYLPVPSSLMGLVEAAVGAFVRDRHARTDPRDILRAAVEIRLVARK